MEAVKTFNSELFSMNDYKPPISKAKMTQITKLAIKAIKFYKHVVQSVEKFIQKCKPEYKVPGLYVIDSIVRQSRHQFGQDKDLFAPRFCINIINTFQNLYRCAADDKSKIVRVLNLWQKNNVFKSEIIQPLLDMAAGINPPVAPVFPSAAPNVGSSSGRRSTQVVKHWVRSQEFQGTSPGSPLTPHVIMGTPVTPVTQASMVQGLPDPWATQITNTDTLTAVAQILQSPQGQQLQQLVQTLQIQQQKPQPSLLQALDAGLVVQLQALTAQLTAAAAASNTLNPLEQTVSLSKRLMDTFDFVDDTDNAEESKVEAPNSQLPLVSESMNNSLFHQLAEHLQQQNLEHFRQQLMEQQPAQVIAQESQESQEESQEVTFGSENSGSPSQGSSQQQFLDSDPKLDDSRDMQQEDMELEEVPEEQDVTEEEIFEQEEKKSVLDSRSRTLSRSHSRSPRKRRSRSRSGSRKRKHRKRSRSRSRERERERDRKRKPTSRSYSSERRAREREKERQKKGLPPIRSKTLSVCSTTLWVGQVDKKATQQDLTNLFEEFGQVESINMIPPRGCAYVCMVHRQDAYRARQKLSAGACKLISKIIKIAWALNKGVKMEYKQFWDVDLGVTYIPWEKVKLDDLRGFAEGGMIDQETMNGEWESLKISEPVKEVKTPPPATTTATVTIATTHAQSAPVPKTPMITTQAAAAYAPMITTQAAAAYAPMITTQAAAAYAPMITTQAAAAYAPMITTQGPAAYAPMMTTQAPAAYAPMISTQAPAAYAPMISTQSAAAYAPMISTQTAAAYNPMITTQAGAPYTQPVTLLQIPVPPTVPTVSLVPPVFPISMSVPPPGYVMPPPPFLRPAFDPTQPPPGYMPPPIPPPTMVPPPSIPPPTITTSLIQPPMSITQETMKDMSFSSLVLPAASVSTSHATPTVSSASVYNPPQSSQGESEEKQCKLSDNPISSTESTATSAVQSNVSSSSAVLGGPAPITTHSMSHLNLSGRMHGMPFLDGQPGLLTQSHGPRFAFMQPGMPPQRNVPPPAIIDPSIPPPPQGPFPPGDFFNRTERSYVTPVQNADNTSNAEKRVQLGSDGIQQEGDRDYRFPPRENRENLNRPAPLEASDGRPVDPQEGLVRQVVAADDVMGRPSVNTQDNQRLVVDARDGLLRPGTDARDGLLRPGTDAREGQLRQGIDAREGFHRQGADSRDSLVRPAADSHEGLQRPGTDLQESLQRAASDSREFQQRMRAGSREALLRQGADSRDGIPRPGMGPREGLLGPGPDSREGLLRLGTFPREGLLGPGPDVREGLLRLRTFPREGLLGDRPVARDNQGRLGSELHEGHGRQESDTEEVRDWSASDTREGPNWPGSSAQEVHNWPRSDAREIHDWQGSDAREGHDWPGSDAHEGQRHPAAELHEVLLRLGTHARESPGRPPLDMRQHLGRPLLDARQPFGRAPIDEREHFGRLPMDGREPFGRPPMEGRETFGRPPVEGRDLYGRLPMEGREVFGRPPMEGRELFVRLPLEGREQFGRPPVDMRDNHGRQSLDAIGRRENFGFNTENKHWGHRDFDERQHHPLPVFGGPQGFHEDRDRFHHGNLRPDIASGPMFNRGLDQDAHRDLDDRRSLWERQRERDDRDVDFRREIINGNRFGRDRQQDTWVPPKPQIFEYFEGTASPTSTSTTPTSSPEKVENLPQVNGESTEADSPPPPVETNKDTELSDKLVPTGEISKEKSDTEADIKSQPVVESTETEGT